MTFFRALLICMMAAMFALAASAEPPPPPHGWQGPGQYPRHYQREHPQHRLAHWYAREAMRQAEAARQMVCGFAGQRWTLDWDVHYRWALQVNPNRIYREVEQRDRHLTRCRSNKIREYRRAPPGRPN